MIQLSDSQICQLFAADPALAAACDGFAQEIRDAAQEDAATVARSERLTREDLEIVINPGA